MSLETTDRPTCYVCTESCIERSPCDCKELYIHIECQSEWINKSGSTECSVCRRPFTNVVVCTPEERRGGSHEGTMTNRVCPPVCVVATQVSLTIVVLVFSFHTATGLNLFAWYLFIAFLFLTASNGAFRCTRTAPSVVQVRGVEEGV